MSISEIFDNVLDVLVRVWRLVEKTSSMTVWFFGVVVLAVIRFFDGGGRCVVSCLDLLGRLLTSVTDPEGAIQQGKGAVVAVAGHSVMTEFIQFFNGFFPLDVLFDCILTYWFFWFLLMSYRLVKSWIPTVSG